MTSYNIVLAQINPELGNIKENANKIIKILTKYTNKADLIVFPELSLLGYPPEDLILRKKLHLELQKYLKIVELFAKKKKISIIVGAPMKIKNSIGNAAIYIHNGKRKIIFKNNLPNYGVFDEKRIFIEGPKYNYIKFKKIKIGLMICEDMWTEKIARNLIKDKVDIFIVINASPYDNQKQIQRAKVAKKIIKITKRPLVYVNQIGGQDELVFDGGSFILDNEGIIVNQLNFWKEQNKNIEIKFKKNKILFPTYEKCFIPDQNFNTWNALVLGLRDYVKKNLFKKVILGLSGGIDSAVSAAIAVDALGNSNVIGVKMPSKFSSKSSIIDADETIRLLKIKSETIKINQIYDKYLTILSKNFKKNISSLTRENLQSRIRGSLLMSFSNNYSYLLISTGNKSEMSVGYSTIYGDMNGGFNVLKDIYKTDLYKLANWRNELKDKLFKGPIGNVIPKNSLLKPPSAELSFNQKDTDSLPEYVILDKILFYLIEKELSIEEICRKGYSEKIVKKILRLLLLSEYKRRQAPPGVKISVKSFGKERRYPITNHFKK